MPDDERHLVLLGGCGGIGRPLTARALSDGWRVTVLDLPTSLERHAPPGDVMTRPIDVSEPASIDKAFEGLGSLDGFVNLAGFMTGVKPIEETGLAEFDEAMTGNLRGAFLAAKAALPLLRRGAAPSMVNIVSGLASNVRPGYGVYGAAKAGMVHLTKTLALEAAPAIRVNAVGPAAVDTAFLRGGTGRSNEDQETKLDVEAYARMTPLARLATPEDVVGPVMFLLGPDSGFMTGQVLWVNGGGYMP